MPSLESLKTESFYAQKAKEKREEQAKERVRKALRKGLSDGLGVVELVGLVREVGGEKADA